MERGPVDEARGLVSISLPRPTTPPSGTSTGSGLDAALTSRSELLLKTSREPTSTTSLPTFGGPFTRTPTFDTPPVTELISLPEHRAVRVLEDNEEVRRRAEATICPPRGVPAVGYRGRRGDGRVDDQAAGLRSFCHQYPVCHLRLRGNRTARPSSIAGRPGTTTIAPSRTSGTWSCPSRIGALRRRRERRGGGRPFRQIGVQFDGGACGGSPGAWQGPPLRRCVQSGDLGVERRRVEHPEFPVPNAPMSTTWGLPWSPNPSRNLYNAWFPGDLHGNPGDEPGRLPRLGSHQLRRRAGRGSAHHSRNRGDQHAPGDR